LKLGASCVTRVWLSEKAQDEIDQFCSGGDPNKTFFKRMQRYAKAGFEKYEGGHGDPIKYEWDGVYRVRPTSGQLRIIGFYENDDRRRFIGIDAFLKKKTRLNVGERGRIDAVADVKRNGDWERDTDEGDYPRIAQ